MSFPSKKVHLQNKILDSISSSEFVLTSAKHHQPYIAAIISTLKSFRRNNELKTLNKSLQQNIGYGTLLIF